MNKEGRNEKKIILWKRGRNPCYWKENKGNFERARARARELGAWTKDIDIIILLTKCEVRNDYLEKNRKNCITEKENIKEKGRKEERNKEIKFSDVLLRKEVIQKKEGKKKNYILVEKRGRCLWGDGGRRESKEI